MWASLAADSLVGLLQLPDLSLQLQVVGVTHRHPAEAQHLLENNQALRHVLSPVIVFVVSPIHSGYS